MKPRIKIDALCMALVVILTGVIFFFPRFYSQNRILEDCLDLIGVLLLLKGLLWRMVARGYKKKFSNQSQGLVTAGPYSLVRNPMYLGTYLIGAGFIVMLWPWWGILIYSLAFYLRFKKQIAFEEDFLNRQFGEEYKNYCQRTPQLFPRLSTVAQIKFREALPLELALTTKEKRAILPVLLAAFAMETIKERIVYGTFTPGITLLTIFAALGILSLGLWIRYQEK